MTNKQIAEYNEALRNKPTLEIVRWAIAQANGRAVVSTNFRPYEAVILHLCVQVQRVRLGRASHDLNRLLDEPDKAADNTMQIYLHPLLQI